MTTVNNSSAKKITSVYWKTDFVVSFKDVCKAKGYPYSTVLRNFISDYLNKNIKSQ